MLSSRNQIVCNEVTEKNGEELCGQLITINPVGVAMAVPCAWSNSSSTNKGTMLYFTNPNISPKKIASDIETWSMWVRENS